MTNEQRAALDLAILNLKTHGDDQLLTAIKPLLDFYENRSAAGASEGQEPVAWRHSKTHCLFDTEEEVPLADGDESAEPLFTHPSAEIAALRERIAGMEKAIAPFVEAFERIHARSYEGAGEAFTAFLDGNTVTPTMTTGDFRRLRDAVGAKEKS